MTGFRLEMVDFLSPQGMAWGLVGQSVERNHTVENIERLLKAATRANIASAHRAYGPDRDDLATRLRRSRVVNFRYIADALWSTDEAVRQM